jgi:predicted secreted Zn-dependent protease
MSTIISDPEQATYDLQGDTLADVAEKITGMDEAAKAEWFPQYSYTSTGQQLATAEVTVSTKITMPRWPGCASAPDADQGEWRRFLAALQAHEQGHLDLVLQHLSNIDERLVRQSPAGARRVWDDALGALQSASDSYDRDTDHGRNQGTIIEVGGAVPDGG